MQITKLLSFGSALSAILEPGAALIVLGSGRWEPAELEVTLVEDAVTITDGRVARARTYRQYQVYHDGGGLPLARRYARIEVGV